MFMNSASGIETTYLINKINDNKNSYYLQIRKEKYVYCLDPMTETCLD